MLASESSETGRCLTQLIGEYDDIIAELKQSLVDGVDSELLTIIREARLDATSKQTQIRVRLGQHRFRRLVLAHWKNCCALTGADILVEASHIKPWRNSSNFDRINPYNGIALSPLYHRAFDLRYISFAEDGSILVAEVFRERLVKIGLNLSARITGLTNDHQPYLEHHRKHIFLK
ncbi:MAG TPA: HNH endonuclease [Verrucomicrobiae bacterium]|nr:HNH endonuclease [Verrucomicrobiae bacterium]